MAEEPLNFRASELCMDGRKWETDMQPAGDSEEMSEERWYCAFASLQSLFVPVAFMLFGCNQAITAERLIRWPDSLQL